MTTSNDKIARLAGLLYLVLLPTTGLWYGTWGPLVTGDPGVTIAHLQASRTFFEIALIAGAVGFVDYLILGLVLYRLFSDVGKDAAALLLAFVAVNTALSLAVVARQIDVLSLLDWGKRLPSLGADQVSIQIMLALRSADSLFLITAIFSGLWLLPLAWLGFRSGYLPRVLAVMLALGGFFYLSSFFGQMLNPDYANTLVARIIGIATGVPGLSAELGTGLWLLIRGTRQRKAAARS